MSDKNELSIGIGTLLLAVGIGIGAIGIPSAAGYAGVGPNFLPWVVAIVLGVCGAWMIYESLSGGFRHREEPDGAEHGDWKGFAWVSAGLLANAATLTHIGFILSCTLCYVFAVRGFHHAEGRTPFAVTGVLRDALIGFAISAPVYWMFGKLLAINLPGLTNTGWI